MFLPYCLGETLCYFLKIFEVGWFIGAGVGEGVEDLLAVGVQVEKADEFDVVVLGLVACPCRQGLGFFRFEGAGAGVAFGAGVLAVGGGPAVPFEGPGAVEVETVAETEGCGLSRFAPESVGGPCVVVAVGVDGGDEDEVEGFKELGDWFASAVGRD